MFYFNAFGDINLIKPQIVLGAHNIIYLLGSTLLQYCNTENMTWTKDKWSEGGVHLQSDVENGFDKQMSHYVNWADGCALNNTLYAAAKFLRDLQESVVENGKYRTLQLMAGDCGYIGYAINNEIDKHGIEIIPDALEAYDNYRKELCHRCNDKQKDPNYWCKYNEKFKKMFDL